MKRWLFIHGFGRLSKEYSKLSQQTEKASFLTREFGINYLDVLEDKNSNLFTFPKLRDKIFSALCRHRMQ